VVWRLDRLGRSLRHLIETIAELQDHDVGFKSLTEGVDTTTAAGRMTFHIFAALAEFERSLIRERTLAGLEAARARGRRGGLPSSITPDKQAAAAAIREQDRPMHAIAAALGVSRDAVSPPQRRRSQLLVNAATGARLRPESRFCPFS
jgi:DNA invertase Pin-like site-specific DNA recombinase